MNMSMEHGARSTEQDRNAFNFNFLTRLAVMLGVTDAVIYGATGTRLDHTLANLHLLAGLSQEGFEARIMAGNLVIYAVTSGCLFLPPVRKGRRVSVFCWGGEAAGVHIKGLLYSLRNATINSIEPLGVSNEGLGQPAKIRVRDGTLLVFREI